jgi:hypothetical protein
MVIFPAGGLPVYFECPAIGDKWVGGKVNAVFLDNRLRHAFLRL